MKTIIKILGQVAMCGWTLSVCAEDPKPAAPAGVTWEQVSQRGKNEAEKAADADALKNLAEAIRGLQCGPSQFVADLTVDYESINTAIEEYVKKVPLTGEAQYLPNLTCQAEVAVNTAEVIQLLQQALSNVTQSLQTDPQTPPQTLAKLRAFNLAYISYYYKEGNQPKLVIKATGVGKPPEQFIKRPAGVAASAASVTTVPAVALPAWAKQTITAKGRAAAVEGLGSSAERAALLAAQLDAVQKLNAIKLDDKTTLGDLAAKQPKIQSAVFGFVCSVPVLNAPQADGSVEMTLTLPLDKLYGAAKNLLPAK